MCDTTIWGWHGRQPQSLALVSIPQPLSLYSLDLVVRSHSEPLGNRPVLPRLLSKVAFHFERFVRSLRVAEGQGDY